MKVMITGATGMIGQLVLYRCLYSDEIKQIISIGRKPLNIQHPKLKELIRTDFMNYEDVTEEFRNTDAAFFCLGAYTGSVSTELLKMITVDYTIEFAEKLRKESPASVFCFLSGAGADLKEKSKTPFAKYKGMAENALRRLNFDKLFIFRPSYIYPVSKRPEPNLMYRITRVIYPLIRIFGTKLSIRSTELAKAMFEAAIQPPSKQILENHEILEYLDNAQN